MCGFFSKLRRSRRLLKKGSSIVDDELNIEKFIKRQRLLWHFFKQKVPKRKIKELKKGKLFTIEKRAK